MFKLKLKKILQIKKVSMYNLHLKTSIRYNTITDMCNKEVKTISIDNLNSICKELQIKDMNELFEYIPDIA